MTYTQYCHFQLLLSFPHSQQWEDWWQVWGFCFWLLLSAAAYSCSWLWGPQLPLVGTCALSLVLFPLCPPHWAAFCMDLLRDTSPRSVHKQPGFSRGSGPFHCFHMHDIPIVSWVSIWVSFRLSVLENRKNPRLSQERGSSYRRTEGEVRVAQSLPTTSQ